MKKKIPTDLIKFGVREYEKRKAYLMVTLSLDSQALTRSATSSHKHTFLDTNLRQGLLQPFTFQSWYVTPSSHQVQNRASLAVYLAQRVVF